MKAQIGIIGGTGLYNLLEDAEEEEIKTPYGETSEKISIGNINGEKVAFIPRHNKKHTIPPHVINHRANIFALKSIGIENIIGTGASGIINTDIKPGEFVIPDDFLDFTKKIYTFFDDFEEKHMHIEMENTFSEKIRKLLIETCKELKYPFHDKGVYVNTSGPRFETPSEIKMFKKMGGDIVAMTNIPELVLSKELGINYATISVGTNYASGVSEDDLSFKEMQSVMKNREPELKEIITRVVKKMG